MAIKIANTDCTNFTSKNLPPDNFAFVKKHRDCIIIDIPEKLIMAHKNTKLLLPAVFEISKQPRVISKMPATVPFV